MQGSWFRLELVPDADAGEVEEAEGDEADEGENTDSDDSRVDFHADRWKKTHLLRKAEKALKMAADVKNAFTKHDDAEVPEEAADAQDRTGGGTSRGGC